MLNRTALLTLLILSLWALTGALGCSNGSTPVIPGSDNVIASADTDADIDSTTGEGRAAAEGVYTGILQDSEGNPLAWADLYLDGELAGWTEEDGSFTIYGVDEETEYTLEARLDDVTVYTSTVSGVTRGGQSYGDFDPTIPRGTVLGFVHDEIGPVPHALVIVFNQNENFGVGFTNDKGIYKIYNAPAGPGHILAFAPQHAIAHDTLVVLEDGIIQKNLFLPILTHKGIVKGQVITGPIGHMRPIPFATVGIKPLNTDVVPKIVQTNRHGIYLFLHVELGPHGIFAEAPCFPAEKTVLNVHPGMNIQMFHLEQEGCGGVEGIVTDVDGNPLPFVLVKLIRPIPDSDKPLVRFEFTGPQGRYRFNPVMPGEVGLEAEAPGFLPYQHPDPIPVIADQFTVINFSMICADDNPDCLPPPPPPPPPPPGGGNGGGG